MHDLVRRDGPKSLGTVALLGLGFLILAALLTIIFVLHQRSSGAYTAEFSTLTGDEAGHVVAGLMVADYLRASLPAPLAFIENYSTHFPALAPGLSLPLYYLAEGVWFTLLEPSTPAVLLLPAVLAALLVASTGWICAERIGVLPAVAVGAVLMVLTPLRHATIVVGLALPLALLALWAAAAWLAFLERKRPRDAVLFGLLAAAAALTYGAGLALALLPILSLGLKGEADLPRSRAFWLALLPLLLVGLWVLGASSVLPASPSVTSGSAVASATALWTSLLDGLGFVLTGLAVAGALFALVDARRADASRLLPVLLFLVVALAFCLIFSPADPELLPVLLAPVVMLAAAGGLRLVGLLISGWPILAGLLVMLVMLLAAMPGLMQPVTKPGNGMDAAAQTFLADAGGPASILVLADRHGEGALIAAVAQRDRRTQSLVLPARTALAGSGSGPARGVSLDAEPAALMAELERLGAGYVVIAASADALLTGRMEAVLAAFPERFKRIGRFAGDGGGTRLYALVSPAAAMQ